MAETTGTDLIREALHIRNRKMNLVAHARNVGVGIDLLEGFIDGRRTLPDAVLRALAKELWPHTEFVPELDVLRPAMQEPAKPLGVPPQLSIPLPRYPAGPAQIGPQPETPAPAPQPKRKGWLESWV